MGIKDDLSNEVLRIIQQSWDVRDGRTVPSNDDVALEGGGVRLDATVLYADLAQSSKLATDFQQRTAGKVIRIFLKCMCRLITEHNGAITSFDGDRVMGIFLGETKSTDAAKCALKMNYATSKIIEPIVKDYFTSVKDAGFSISHCVGVDTSAVMAVRAGQRGSNDLVWVGRAPNLAAKLSEIRENYYHSWITEDVFRGLDDSAKFGGPENKLMWEKRSFQYIGEPTAVYGSTWWWEP
jgi:class 3 adenylate cyclase